MKQTRKYTTNENNVMKRESRKSERIKKRQIIKIWHGQRQRKQYFKIKKSQSDSHRRSHNERSKWSDI